MQISFDKYQGTGNDFILIDNRKKEIQLSVEQVALYVTVILVLVQMV
jgi:diaminopimelate epimerase